MKVYYISGPSGAGKSLKAKELLIEHNYEEFDEVKFVNGFWLGITNG